MKGIILPQIVMNMFRQYRLSYGKSYQMNINLDPYNFFYLCFIYFHLFPLHLFLTYKITPIFQVYFSTKEPNSFPRNFQVFFYTLIVGVGVFNPWTSPLETPRGTKQLSYKTLSEIFKLAYKPNEVTGASSRS